MSQRSKKPTEVTEYAATGRHKTSKTHKQTARIKKNSNYITVTIIVINTQNIELNQ